MNIILILFFISLLGIIFMIGRKHRLIQKSGIIIKEEEILLVAPDFTSIKYITIKKLRKYGYILILITLRLSVRGSHFLKSKWLETTKKIRNKMVPQNNESEEIREISKFLQTVTEYKNKFKKIKKKIKEEEGLM